MIRDTEKLSPKIAQPMVHSDCFFFSSRRRHTRFDCDWSSDVCSSDLDDLPPAGRDVGNPIVAVRSDGSLKHHAAILELRADLDRASVVGPQTEDAAANARDRKSTRLNSSHSQISYAVFCLKKKKRQDV